MNLFKALEAASLRLNQNDPEFDSQANLATDILRSAGVYPHRRSSLNGHVHKLLSAAIVHVYQQDTSLDVQRRRRWDIRPVRLQHKASIVLDQGRKAWVSYEPER